MLLADSIFHQEKKASAKIWLLLILQRFQIPLGNKKVPLEEFTGSEKNNTCYLVTRIGHGKKKERKYFFFNWASCALEQYISNLTQSTAAAGGGDNSISFSFFQSISYSIGNNNPITGSPLSRKTTYMILKELCARLNIFLSVVSTSYQGQRTHRRPNAFESNLKYSKQTDSVPRCDVTDRVKKANDATKKAPGEETMKLSQHSASH